MKKLLAAVAVVAACVAWTAAVADAQRPNGLGNGAGSADQGQGPGRQGRLGGPRGMFGRGGPAGPGGPGAPGFMLGGLNLSDDQQAQVKAAVEADRSANKDLRKAAGDAHQALRAAILGANANSGDIASLQAKVAASEQARLAADVKLQTTIAGILTPEQRAALLARGGPGRGRGGDSGRTFGMPKR